MIHKLKAKTFIWYNVPSFYHSQFNYNIHKPKLMTILQAYVLVKNYPNMDIFLNPFYKLDSNNMTQPDTFEWALFGTMHSATQMVFYLEQ